MEYDILMARKIGELNKLVNEEITKGWEPIGGVCAVYENDFNGKKIQYIQAIIKR